VAIDSAIRMLVQEVVREIVAEEVRAQISARAVDATALDVSGVDASPDATPPGRETASGAVAAERAKTAQQLPRAPSDPNQPNFDAAEAAWFLRYPAIKAFYHAVRRHGIPHSRKGQRSMLFKRVDLERFLASRSRFR
jgi:hypothetical protein